MSYDDKKQQCVDHNSHEAATQTCNDKAAATDQIIPTI